MPPPLQQLDALIAAGKLQDAEKLAASLLQRRGSDLDALGAMTFLLLKRREFVRGEHFARRTLALVPDNPEAMTNLGAALTELGRFSEALPHLQTALKLLPHSEIVRGHLCGALGELKRFEESLRVASDGLAGNPHSAPLHAFAALACSRLGLAQDGLRLIDRACQLAPGNAPYCSSRCTIASYVPDITADQTKRFAIEHANAMQLRYGPPLAPSALLTSRASNPAGTTRRLRVGIVSPDLRHHAVAAFIGPFIRNYDRVRIELSLYHSGSVTDSVSSGFKAGADSWQHVHGWSYVKLTETIRVAGTDVLIDLAAHSLCNALPTFQMRAAPVQITYCGFPGSTGLPAMDYRLTDRLTDPPDDSPEQAFTERLLYVPTSSHCFSPLSPLPDVAPSPLSGGNPLTFGSLSSPMKLNDSLLKTWAAILKQLPASRLLIKHEQLASESDRAHLARRAAAAGIPSNQLMIEPPAAGSGTLPEQYSRVDIALDTAPYTGTTTVCEALLMGVPVITLRGNLTQGRVGAAMLTMAGLGDFIATTPQHYQNIALQLAADLPRLKALRSTLRQQVQSSPLCDEKSFARDLSETLVALRPEATV